MAKRAVFVDRDGTLIEDPGYLRDPAAVTLLPAAASSLRRLRDAGYEIVVVTNQSGIARGLLDEPTLEAIHDRMKALFAEEGAAIDAIYYCPYLDGPEAVVEAYRQDSDLRKPHPGMFLQAARERGIDLRASWAIGDSARDVEAGRAAGCRTVLIAREATVAEGDRADVVVATLADAVEHILRTGEPHSPPTGEEGDVNRSEQLLEEIVEHVRAARRERAMDDFTLAKLVGVVAQLLAVAVGVWALAGTIDPPQNMAVAHRWLAAVFVQLVALTFFLLHRRG